MPGTHTAGGSTHSARPEPQRPQGTETALQPGFLRRARLRPYVPWAVSLRCPQAAVGFKRPHTARPAWYHVLGRGAEAVRAETPARAWAEPGRCRKPTADSPCRGCGPAPDCTRKRRPWRSCKQAVVRESSAECGGRLTRSGGQRQPRGRAGGPSSRAGRGAGGGHRGPWAVLPPSRSRGPLGSGRQKARRRGRCGGRGGGGRWGSIPRKLHPHPYLVPGYVSG